MKNKCDGCEQSFSPDELNSIPHDDCNSYCEECQSEINSNNNDYWGG